VPYDDVLVHVATPVRRTSTGAWAEGERVATETEGTPFACCLFVPLGAEEASPRGGRTVRRPTLLVSTLDEAGVPVSLAAEDELLILAPELNASLGAAAGERVRWQVSGGLQPFGRPGDSPVGGQVELTRVED
jgi:hypothetical protein